MSCVPLSEAQIRQLTSTRFDSSVGRGPFRTSIGVGEVIKGTLPSCLLPPWTSTNVNNRLG